MTAVPDLIANLTARGITVTVHNNRLRIAPARAYRDLTDDEILMLRHHRQAIKDAILSGDAPAVVNAPTTPTPEKDNDVKSLNIALAQQCPYCYHSPCVGPDHKHFWALHPLVRQQLQAESNTRVLLAALTQ